MTVQSTRLIRAGEEVLNYYGPRPNSELLRQYGYVTQDHSRYDVVEVPWSLVEAQVREALNVDDMAWMTVSNHVDSDDLEDGFVIERDCPDVNADGTYSGPAILREMPADLVAQLKHLLQAVRKVDESMVPSKRKRDHIIQQVLSGCVTALIRRYPTTIEEDVHRLAKGSMSARCRMAVLVRLGEKQLLQEALTLLKQETDEIGEAGGRDAKKLRR